MNLSFSQHFVNLKIKCPTFFLIKRKCDERSESNQNKQLSINLLIGVEGGWQIEGSSGKVTELGRSPHEQVYGRVYGNGYSTRISTSCRQIRIGAVPTAISMALYTLIYSTFAKVTKLPTYVNQKSQPKEVCSARLTLKLLLLPLLYSFYSHLLLSL